MFPKTKNIETTFQLIRRFCIVLVIGCLSCSALIAWQAFRMVERAQERIYVLSSGKALEAFAGDRKENIPAEARDHIRSFHQYFFTLAPDEAVIPSIDLTDTYAFSLLCAMSNLNFHHL